MPHPPSRGRRSRGIDVRPRGTRPRGRMLGAFDSGFDPIVDGSDEIPIGWTHGPELVALGGTAPDEETTEIEQSNTGLTDDLDLLEMPPADPDTMELALDVDDEEDTLVLTMPPPRPRRRVRRRSSDKLAFYQLYAVIAALVFLALPATFSAGILVAKLAIDARSPQVVAHFVPVPMPLGDLTVAVHEPPPEPEVAPEPPPRPQPPVRRARRTVRPAPARAPRPAPALPEPTRAAADEPILTDEDIEELDIDFDLDDEPARKKRKRRRNKG